MSFSEQIKEEFNKTIPNNKDILKCEVLGYFLSGNSLFENENIVFITENEFNIERFYKILFKLQIDYEPLKDGKKHEAIVKKEDVLEILNLEIYNQEEWVKAITRGAFLGSGYTNNPEKKYHLEINFLDEEKARFLMHICKNYNLKVHNLFEV